ncbi:hypothetical protein GN244_ATG02061 [Phytophthora infestans]|uniref:C1q domain-containing protein n=1 Tax=Phytophthora infestans TaxID=4787 RepID=A0A833TS04_PHYIN|nr:hypothetical protein GN244_ATG02061 [Phytophthora infestans]
MQQILLTFCGIVLLQCFRECLDCQLGEDEDAERKLTPQNGGTLQLELMLKIRLLRSARKICYTFKLQPLSVERIDILESKLKDQQEELLKMRAKVDAESNVFLCAESEALVEEKLQWKDLSSDFFCLDDIKTSITVLVPGTYILGVLMSHTPLDNDSASIVVEMNNVQIQSAKTGVFGRFNGYGGYVSYQANTSLMCISQIDKSAQISVVCSNTTFTPKTSAYLTAVRIGA